MLHPDVWHIPAWEAAVRIGLALLLGGLVGLERELGGHSAGFRTNILVCLGSTLLMLLSIYGFSQFAAETNVRLDPARVAAQVVSGIGFLGAGTIFRTGNSVSGLTTAASLWVVSAIGLAIGAGFYGSALLVTALVLISLFVLNKFEMKITRPRKSYELTVRMAEGDDRLDTVTKTLEAGGAIIGKLSLDHEDGAVKIRLILKIPRPAAYRQALVSLSAMDEVLHIDAPYVGEE